MTKKKPDIRPVRIEGDTAFITLTRGFEAVIDAVDVPLVMAGNWYASVQPYTVYAVRSQLIGDKREAFRLHRVIMQPGLDQEVDHIDRDGLNNRRSNLRLASRSENARNQGRRSTSASGFKGVTWHQRSKKWAATISVLGKQIHLGLFQTPQDAHATYVAAATELHGEFARTS